jgi:hypothetical protein
MILLKRSPHYGRITLDLMLTSISPKIEGWTKDFLVDVLMKGSALGAYSNYLEVPREEPSLVSASYSLGALDESLLVRFLGGILPTSRTQFETV